MSDSPAVEAEDNVTEFQPAEPEATVQVQEAQPSRRHVMLAVWRVIACVALLSVLNALKKKNRT